MKPDKNRKTQFFVLIGIAVLALVYSRFPCHRYFIDGLTSASEIEYGSRLSIHPNHPLFPLVPQIIFDFIVARVPDASALGFLLLWSIAFGVLSCWLFTLVLRKSGLALSTILISLGLFGFSAGSWFFFATPNQYSTALAFHLFTLVYIAGILRNDKVPTIGQSIGLGALIGLAILAHQVNALLIVPAIYALYVKRGKISVNLSAMIIPAILISVGGLLFSGFVLAGIRNFSEFITWQKSYVTRSWYWASGLSDAFVRSLHGKIEVFLAHVFHSEGLFGDWSMNSPPGVLLGRFLLRIGQAYVLVFLTVETFLAFFDLFKRENRSPLKLLGLFTLLPIALFASVFTPESINYRIFYLPGYFLFLAFRLERKFKLRNFAFKKAWPVILAVIFIFLCNFIVKFLPESNPKNNPYIAEAGLIADSVNPGCLFVFSGADDDYLRAQYVRYFAHEDILFAYELIDEIRSNPNELVKSFLGALNAGKTVFVHEDVLNSDYDIKWLNDFYGLDIKPGEFKKFFRIFSRDPESILINDKKYYIINPVPIEPPPPASSSYRTSD